MQDWKQECWLAVTPPAHLQGWCFPAPCYGNSIPLSKFFSNGLCSRWLFHQPRGDQVGQHPIGRSSCAINKPGPRWENPHKCNMLNHTSHCYHFLEPLWTDPAVNKSLFFFLLGSWGTLATGKKFSLPSQPLWFPSQMFLICQPYLRSIMTWGRYSASSEPSPFLLFTPMTLE